MRAAVRTRYGPPEVVRIAEVPEPTAGEHDVLVRVHATTVNRTDRGVRAAEPWFVRFFFGLVRPKVGILGTDFAGEVVAVGGRVSTFAVGDRVFGFSEDRFGAHAELLACPADGAIATIPDGVGYEDAAASIEGAHYARTLVRKAGVGSGHRVLVNGATGAIGSAAVQLSKALGADVTAVCEGRHAELVRGLGADRVIDRTTEDFTRRDERYHAVIDAVGKSSFGRCRRLLEPRGIYVSTELGPLSLNPLLSLVTPLFGGRRASLPVRKHSQDEMREQAELIAAGSFRAVIDRRYAFEEIVEAHRYVDTGQKVGNVVIRVVP